MCGQCHTHWRQTGLKSGNVRLSRLTYLVKQKFLGLMKNMSIFHYVIFLKQQVHLHPHIPTSLAPRAILLSEPDGWISVYGVQSPKKIIEMTISNDFDLK